MEIWNWIKARLGERSTWDGGAIIALCILIFISAPIAKYVAAAGIVYGAYLIYLKEVKNKGVDDEQPF